MPSSVQKCRLVADVGGTNSRLALYDPVSNDFRARRDYINRQYSRFEDIIAHWLQQLNEAPPKHGCLAIAAPPFDDVVSMFNMDWSFSCSALAKTFAFDQLRCINDFESNAYALLHLIEDDLVTLRSGNSGDSGPLAVVGPGTGLGGSTLGLVDGVPVAAVCEPGHMGLAPASELELALFGKLLLPGREVHAESLLSGPGILKLYSSLGELLSLPTPPLSAEEITARAIKGGDEACSATLNMFAGLLGSICGDFVLAQGAYGGLYLSGGILPGIIPFLRASTFLERFQSKGSMAEHLARVPIHVIISGRAGLLGAAHAPL